MRAVASRNVYWFFNRCAWASRISFNVSSYERMSSLEGTQLIGRDEHRRGVPELGELREPAGHGSTSLTWQDRECEKPWGQTIF